MPYLRTANGRVHGFSRFDDPWRFELLRLSDHEQVHIFADNSEVRDKAKPLLENKSEFFQIEIGNGITLDGWMIRPKDFDSSRKYPVLVNVYGEPAGQTVVDRWGGAGGLFHRALAQDGYIVVSFDNRGTPAPKGPRVAKDRLWLDRAAGNGRANRGNQEALRGTSLSGF